MQAPSSHFGRQATNGHAAMVLIDQRGGGVSLGGLKPSLQARDPGTGLRLMRDRGQHLLKNRAILEAIVEKCELQPTDTVLEIGPGTGNLTVLLLPRVRRVIAVEVDPRMANELRRRVAGTQEAGRLQLVLGDAIKDVAFPAFDVCVANTPYQISSPLIFKLLAHHAPFRAAILLLQREFAMRLVARPGESNYGRLSINAQLFAKCKHLMKVGRANFRPPPHVDSSLVMITPRRPAPQVAMAEWDGLIKAAFSRKNKTLRGALTGKRLLQRVARNAAVIDPCAAAATEDGAKDAIERVLEERKLLGGRAGKLAVSDLLNLLGGLRERGVHII